MTVQQLIDELITVGDKSLEVRRVDSYYSDQMELSSIWYAPDDKQERIQVVMIG